MRKLRNLVFVVLAAGCVRVVSNKPSYPASAPDSLQQKRVQSATVPVHPSEKGPVALDRRTEPVSPADVNLAGSYKPGEPPIPRPGPQPVVAEPAQPKIVISGKKEEPKTAMAPPPAAKPVELPEIIRGEGGVQSIALDRDSYRQGEVATLTVTAVLPLDHARIDFLDRKYKVYPTGEKNIYQTVLAVPIETPPDSYVMTISYDESGEQKNLRLPFKVTLGAFPHRDTTSMDIAILTQETLEMMYYEGGYFANAYTLNPDSLTLDRNFIWPCSGTITSLFGGARKYNKGMDRWRHRGLDIAAVVGTPVVAPCDGIVSLAKSLDVHGKSIVIAHGGGVHTVYLHLSRIAVYRGERVKKGQIIGYVGRTGLVTGPNLHWQVMVDGVATDPRSWVQGGAELGRHDHVDSELAGESNR